MIQSGISSTSSGYLGCNLTYRWGREITHKTFGHAKSSLAGIRKKILTKIEAHVGMVERLIRHLEIEEALQMEKKYKLSHNNQSHVQRCALSD